jgi:hypothetical protein
MTRARPFRPGERLVAVQHPCGRSLPGCACGRGPDVDGMTSMALRPPLRTGQTPRDTRNSDRRVTTCVALLGSSDTTKELRASGRCDTRSPYCAAPIPDQLGSTAPRSALDIHCLVTADPRHDHRFTGPHRSAEPGSSARPVSASPTAPTDPRPHSSGTTTRSTRCTPASATRRRHWRRTLQKADRNHRCTPWRRRSPSWPRLTMHTDRSEPCSPRVLTRTNASALRDTQQTTHADRRAS